MTKLIKCAKLLSEEVSTINKEELYKKNRRGFLDKLVKTKGTAYIMVGTYKGMRNKTKFRHETCGYEWETTPDTILHSLHGCPECAGNKRTNTREFAKKVYEETNGEYTVLGEYINARVPIMVKHNTCGKKYKVAPYSFTSQKTRCPFCNPRRKITHEEFLKRIEDQGLTGYTFHERYVNNRTKLLCTHEKCGYTWKANVSGMMERGNGCPKCAGNAPWTEEDFNNRIAPFLGEYQFLGEFHGRLKKIKVKHLSCGHEYMVTPQDFLSGSRCPKCAHHIKLTHEDFLKRVKDTEAEGYTFLEEYTGIDDKLLCQHACGYTWRISPYNFLRGERCPRCKGCAKVDYEEFTHRMHDNVPHYDQYEIVGEYKSYKEPLTMRHSCGTIWETVPEKFLASPRCPKCDPASTGERKVYLMLESLGVASIETQKWFKECYYINPLRFDFYLPDYGALIEYDGGQHYKPVNYGGQSEEKVLEDFNNIQKRDNIKNEFCKENNYPLLRIPYYQSDEEIKESLVSFINSLEK